MATEKASVLKDIMAALQKLEYGSLVITVHEGQITQIETTEKKRYPLKAKERKSL